MPEKTELSFWEKKGVHIREKRDTFVYEIYLFDSLVLKLKDYNKVE